MDTRDALALARRLLAEHGLSGWTVGLDRAKTRAGACHYSRRLITLSAPLTRLHTEDDVRDTILHEIAHALVQDRVADVILVCNRVRGALSVISRRE